MKEFSYEGKPVKLSRAVEKYAPEVSYNYLKKLLENKDVRVNGVKVREDVSVSDGDIIRIYNKAAAEKTVYEDGAILVIYKPKGVASEGAGSIEERLAALDPDLKLCHRLDTNTDGLLIFAKTEEAYGLLLEAFKEKYIEKFYIARVYGRVKNDFTLSGYLVKDSENGVVRVTDKPAKGAVKIITAVKVLETYKDSSLVEVSPVTGKTHQIRAHLASVGHFVLGDGKYGRDDINRRFNYKKQHQSPPYGKRVLTIYEAFGFLLFVLKKYSGKC